MSELWRQLVENADPALSEQVRLAQVQISKSTGAMVIILNAARILTRKEFRVLEKAFSGAFPSVRVTLTLQYPAMREAVEKDIKVATGLLAELVAHESPASMPFLEWDHAEWKLEGGKLTVCVISADGAAFLKSRSIDKLLEELLLRLFGISAVAQIKVTGEDDKKLREIEEARQRELDMLAEEAKKGVSDKPRCQKPSEAVFGRTIADHPIPMNELAEDTGRATVKGEVSGLEMRDAKNGQSKIATFSMTDHKGSVNCKIFLTGVKSRDDAQSVQKQVDALSAALKDGLWIKARGNYRYDDFKREMMLMVSDIMTAQKPVREDVYGKKRVELHCHTQMSSMDACASVTDLFKRAKDWDHKALAITDHGVPRRLCRSEEDGGQAHSRLRGLPHQRRALHRDGRGGEKACGHGLRGARRGDHGSQFRPGRDHRDRRCADRGRRRGGGVLPAHQSGPFLAGQDCGNHRHHHRHAARYAHRPGGHARIRQVYGRRGALRP
jgi:DNA polymerase III alpha subunit (gram-positive type)